MTRYRDHLAAADTNGQLDHRDPTIEMKTIAVLGGTGAVGTDVTQILATMNHRVIAVSRHADQAQTVAAGLPNATGIAGSLGDPASLGAVEPGVAINCTGIEDATAIQRWRDAGWAIIDITASSNYATELAAAPHTGPPLVVGVGLTPGLTSVLARELVALDPATKSATISCLVGLGEEYGDASRNWTYGQLGRRIEDATGPFRNFSSPEPITFPGGFGTRPAWRFDFADRGLLPAELGVHVTTRYCFDSRLAGRALATAAAVPKAPDAMRRLNRLSRRTVAGTAWWAGVVETDTGARATAIGNGQSHGTAAVTAIAADSLARPTAPSDARYLWDLIDTDALRSELAGLGVLTDITHEGNDR